MRIRSAESVLRIAVLAAALPAAFAQSPTATITGIVRDPQGANIPGVEVTATTVATKQKVVYTTNDDGLFSLRQLPIGEYVIEAEKAGFRRFIRRGLVLTTGQNLQLDIQMEVGAVSESITVSGSATLLETRTSDVSQLVEAKAVEDLPLGDRRSLNLIQMTGAAVFIGYDSGQKPNFSLAGSRQQSQMFWIDGGTGQNMRLGVGQVDLDPPVETVAEVKIMANGYSAEYGGSNGGVIVATTKSGTNQLHGSLFEYLRNEKLDAANFFAPIVDGRKDKAPLRYNVFGGTVGGPVWLPKLYNGKDRTFFFFAYEGSRRRDGAIRTLTVPTLLAARRRLFPNDQRRRRGDPDLRSRLNPERRRAAHPDAVSRESHSGVAHRSSRGQADAVLSGTQPRAGLAGGREQLPGELCERPHAEQLHGEGGSQHRLAGPHQRTIPLQQRRYRIDFGVS